MKKSKHSIMLALMISSISLLLVLQFLWLHSAYNRAMDDFHRETNMLFRNMVLTMRDSIIEQSIEPLAGDTSAGRNFRFHIIDTSRMHADVPDSLLKQFDRKEKISKVRVLVTPDDSDSLDSHVLRPLASKFYNYKGQSGDFILRLGADSLRLDSLEDHFKIVLTNAGIDLPFEVVRVKRGEHPPSTKGFFYTEIVRVNPGNRYAVSFANVNPLLVKEIIPQILFSFFLTLLTIGSFIVMYRSIKSQQRLAEMKNDFISNVTHELKTPITTVRVALEALSNFRGLDNPQLTKEYLDIAQNELNRLSLLTDKVLRTAIFESNGVVFKAQSVNVRALLEQILASLRLVVEKAGAAVTLKTEGDDFFIQGSDDHLANVFYNLLDNALKYGGDRLTIAVTLQDKGDRVVISVFDSGPGIASEYHKRIFEKFFRVPSGDIHNVKGYGLGLSYVASVIKGHQGTIEVDSSPGNGCRFAVTLPRGEQN